MNQEDVRRKGRKPLYGPTRPAPCKVPLRVERRGYPESGME